MQEIDSLFFTFSIVLLTGLVIALTPTSAAYACAMCQTVLPQASDPLARGMFWSVLFLLSAPFVVSAAIGGWLLYQYRRVEHPPRSGTPGIPLLSTTTTQKGRA